MAGQGIAHAAPRSIPSSAATRFLLVAAERITVRSDPKCRRRYVQLAMRRERAIAKIAIARWLAVESCKGYGMP